MMVKALLKFFFKLGGLTIALAGIHYYVFITFFSEQELYFPIWSIYLFNAALVLLVYSILYYKNNKGNKKGYNQFLILTLLKMVLSIIFLSPLFFDKSDNTTTEVINFFIPYFIFLTFEIVTLSNFFRNQ